MWGLICLAMLFTQAGDIKVTQEVIIPKTLQKEVLTDEEMKEVMKVVGGIFMGITADSNYVVINEYLFPVDKKVFNFKNLPEPYTRVYVKLDQRGKEKVAVFVSKDFDEAVNFKVKGGLK